MSRIGKLPIAIPDGVSAALDGADLRVKGAKGELSMTFVDEVEVSCEDNVIRINSRDDSKRSRSMWGMQRSLAQNLITGVTEGFTKNLELVGVGYRAAVQGKTLNLQLGYSHDINFPVPEGITIECERPTMIKVSGIDAQKVGQVAAEIRGYRKPEPYKGKGVKYVGEYIFRKEGKKK